MLSKLLKYDLSYIFKILTVFYILSLFFAVLSRILLNVENSFLINIIGQICSGVTISMIFNILINTTMRIWVRFKNNFYSDEAYLTHTLPVKKQTLYLSKTLATIFSLSSSFIVIIASLFIAYYSKENFELLKNIISPITKSYNASEFSIFLLLLLILFLEFFNILECGFTGIILGHKMNNAKTGFSVLYGFLVYIFTQVIVLTVVFATALFNKDILNLIITDEVINIESTKILLYIALALYIAVPVILHFVNNKLFSNGVNID